MKHLWSQGIPIELALLSILAAFGAAFGVLYVALTQQTMGRRRRRRSGSEVHEEEERVAVSVKLADIFMFGEFQNALWRGKSFSGKMKRSIFLRMVLSNQHRLCTPG